MIGLRCAPAQRQGSNTEIQIPVHHNQEATPTITPAFVPATAGEQHPIISQLYPAVGMFTLLPIPIKTPYS